MGQRVWIIIYEFKSNKEIKLTCIVYITNKKFVSSQKKKKTNKKGSFGLLYLFFFLQMSLFEWKGSKERKWLLETFADQSTLVLCLMGKMKWYIGASATGFILKN